MGWLVLAVFIVLEEVKQELHDLRGTDSVDRPQTCHGHRNRLLQEVVLEVGEVVLPDDVRARVGSKHLPEDGHHGRGPRPRRHHVVGHLAKAKSSSTANSVEAVFILDGVCQRQTGWRRGEVGEGVDGLDLGRDVTLVPQLVLPLVIRLGEYHLPQQQHVRVHTNPQNRRVSVHCGEVHVHLLAGAERNFLLLVPPAFRVTRDVVLRGILFDL